MAWVYAFSPLSLRRFLSSFPRSVSRFAKETEQDGGADRVKFQMVFALVFRPLTLYVLSVRPIPMSSESGVAKVEYQTLVATRIRILMLGLIPVAASPD